jgi:hypothetical protein
VLLFHLAVADANDGCGRTELLFCGLRGLASLPFLARSVLRVLLLQLGLRILELLAKVIDFVAALAAFLPGFLQLASSFLARFAIRSKVSLERRNLAPEVDCVSNSPEEENDEDGLELVHGFLGKGLGLAHPHVCEKALALSLRQVP